MSQTVEEAKNSHFSFSHHPSHEVLWMTGHTERKRSAS